MPTLGTTTLTARGTVLSVEEAKANLAAAQDALGAAEAVDPLRHMPAAELAASVKACECQIAFYAKRRADLQAELARRGG